MEERLITVTCPPCVWCGKETHMRVPVQGWIKRMDGESVQACFPHMRPDQREMLISGTHPVCWDMMMQDMRMEEQTNQREDV